jgi:hypothetical protein
MSKEYIEREAVINTFCEDCERHSDENPFACSMCEDVKEIMKIPAADVETVRHGEWMEVWGGPWVLGHKCSICNYYNEKTPMRLEPTPYCPNCGAKMNGGNK